MAESIIRDRAYKFGLDVIKICINMPKNSVGYAVSSQLVRAATSVGANVEEAQEGMSRADFLKCMNISLKEAREARYWIRLSIDSGLIEKSKRVELLNQANEILFILTRIVKSTKLNK